MDPSRMWSPDFLSEISVAVVAALEADDTAGTTELADRIANLEARARATADEDLAAYFGVLRRLLGGDDPAEAAAALAEPYRSGYERIQHELRVGQDHPAASTSPDWLASLTSVVASTARHGSREDRLRLEQELGNLEERNAGDDLRFRAFVDALRAVLRGEDTRRQVIGLQPPYRDAFLSLLQILAADDSVEFTREALLERVRHNTVVALTQGNREVRAAVAATLAELSQQLTGETDIEHLRTLLTGSVATLEGRRPSPSVDTLPEPYATVWREILAAAEKPSG
jgi:uncharacterized protein (DUF2267 family)